MEGLKPEVHPPLQKPPPPTAAEMTSESTPTTTMKPSKMLKPSAT